MHLETVARGDSSRIADPRAVVVRTPGEWRALWAAHAGPDAGEPPPVDFEARMVAAVFAGERPTPGFEVAITGSRREGTALGLVVEERQPDPGAVAAQIVVSPFHIVTVPRYDGTVRFVDASVRAGPATPTTDHRPSRQASSTGLQAHVAGALAYLAGPFSGALLLGIEQSSTFVRFHAWQSLIGLGVLGFGAVLFLVLAFVLLVVSPTAFWTMLWASAITALVTLVVWALCIVQAYQRRRWKLPVAGAWAERMLERVRTPPAA